jgi:ubiquinone/menaquinone biosynthesis C-methylase UbiE
MWTIGVVEPIRKFQSRWHDGLALQKKRIPNVTAGRAIETGGRTIDTTGNLRYVPTNILQAPVLLMLGVPCGNHRNAIGKTTMKGQAMSSGPGWQYDERKFAGVDYSRSDEVAAYDRMHQKFRDYAKSTDEIIRRLSLNADSTVIDLGSGTGAFALHAAKKCRTIYAVDISAAMLDYCRRQAETEGLTNIVFCHGGLLTYEHPAESADAAVCVAVLHHLPDFWKGIALTRCGRMLKPGGRFYLFDIVFPSHELHLDEKIDAWIGAIATMADARLAAEAVVHAREEFSTYDWIMEGILTRSGFHIDHAEYGPGFQTAYVCTKR